MVGGVLLLTGVPGIGKTTVIRRVADRLKGRRLGGFYTEEIREQGDRRGFQLVGFDGIARIIAHVDFPKVHRVGKYGVDVEAIDSAGDRLGLDRSEIHLVDEIGKMECLSDRFVSGMRALLAGPRPIARPLPCTVAALSKRSNEGEAPLFGK
jgi:nucleoside-triphosphatase